MHGKVKLTKRQIKEDKFATFMLTAKDRLSENWQYWAIGGAAVVLAIAALFYYVSSSRSAKTDAGEKYAQALMDYRNGQSQVAILALNQIVTDNADDATSRQSLYMLGKLNLESKNYPEAIRYFEQFIAKYKSDKLTYAAAVAGIAICDENQGQFADAAAKYLEATQAFPGGPAENDYLASAVRAYLNAGDVEKARAGLKTLKEKYKGTELTTEAERLFAEKGSIASGS